MYIYERKPFKKIYEHNFKNSYDIHFHFKNSKTSSHVPHLDLLMCSSQFSWIVKPLHVLECWKCPLQAHFMPLALTNYPIQVDINIIVELEMQCYQVLCSTLIFKDYWYHCINHVVLAIYIAHHILLLLLFEIVCITNNKMPRQFSSTLESKWSIYNGAKSTISQMTCCVAWLGTCTIKWTCATLACGMMHIDNNGGVT